MADAPAKQTILVLEDALPSAPSCASSSKRRGMLSWRRVRWTRLLVKSRARRNGRGAHLRREYTGRESLAGVGRLQQIEPALKVLYISGESVGTALPPGSSFLQKPFPPDALLKKIEGLLAG